jgi:hypothetical protein
MFILTMLFISLLMMRINRMTANNQNIDYSFLLKMVVFVSEQVSLPTIVR